MPFFAGDFLRGLVEVEDADRRVFRDRLALGGRADVNVHLAEVGGQGFVIGQADRLVAEEDHLEFGQRLVQFLDHGRGKRLGQIDVVNLGADMRGGREHANILITHGLFFPCCLLRAAAK